MEFDPDVERQQYSQEEEMALIRANDLYITINMEWDEIVLGSRVGEFEVDLRLSLKQQDYFDKIVYERAWEVKDIIDTLIEGKYQQAKLFGNYLDIYENLKIKHGKECARELMRLAKLMGKCVSPEVSERREQIIESITPTDSHIQDA